MDTLAPPLPPVPAHCTVDLISKFQRPYLFEVRVFADKPPFLGQSRLYEVESWTEAGAARTAMARFTVQMMALRRGH